MGDAPTVQAGVDSAAVGDTVLVHPGTYNEAINFLGKAVVVLGDAGPEQTTLDATGMFERVVTIEAGESRAAVLTGFTVMHGQGGISVINSQPSIIGNIIKENETDADGGGIWCWEDTPHPWNPLIQGNTIIDNRAGDSGGGIGVAEWMVAVVIDNYIAGNEASDGNGGGIYYRGFDNNANFSDNMIVSNLAGNQGGGIYVALSESALYPLEPGIGYNLIANNVATGVGVDGESGGGVTLVASGAWVHHNTIVGNTGDGPDSTYGGGIVVDQAGSPTIQQNIIALSTKGGGIWCGNGATPLIQDNLAWENLPADGVGSCADWWQFDGNVVADPYFCNVELGDYTLAENSPALTHPAGPLGAFPTPGCGETVSTPGDPSSPTAFAMHSARPNPFRSATVIAFEIPSSAAVELTIFDVSGRRVRELVTQVYGPGRHLVPWDGADQTGCSVPSGIYFVRMTAGDFSSSQRLVAIR